MYTPNDNIANDCSANLERRIIADEVRQSQIDIEIESQMKEFKKDPAEWLSKWVGIDLQIEMEKAAEFCVDR